ncbi:PREDICTED: uncharacterized protein LOC109169837 [Ipomoea nil]|uniref:uncharacterized protein LOC109169837 n=1 Tax=Ipomoea nil TaxID=35883 RepID=UPI000900E46F|nr:PREDICTED: uncharacterized protein LOC109169837 [Ipomoea nil]
MSKKQLQIVQNVQRAQYTPQKLDNHSYAAPSHNDFAGLLVGNSPSGRFTGARATMTIWKPKLNADNQYSSGSLYVEDGDNQIRVGWIVNPGLYGDSRTRLFSRWTSDNYEKTGCYINRCPGFVITSNVVPLDYGFPQTSKSYGEQFDVTLEMHKGTPTSDWELYYNGNLLGTWTRSIFSKMGESARQLRFGGEIYEPENEDNSPQMGSGTFKYKKYDRTAYMRRLAYSDPVKGDFSVGDAMILQVQESRCFLAGAQAYNSGDDWWRYSFIYGGTGGPDHSRCVY